MVQHFDPPLTVTRPTLPDFDTYAARLREIWDARWLTNHGPIHGRLEETLRHVLRAPRVSLFANGTLALEAALTALGLTGEVITTPFTYVATANAIKRCGLEPVFVDVDPLTMTIDPRRVDEAVSHRTSAILGVHVFGQPCDHGELVRIADRHGLALIYDAAHALDLSVGGVPVSTLGDVAMFSLHATKPVQAVEGGVLAFRDAGLGERLYRFRNHGLAPGGEDVEGIATNAKMSELHALMCLLVLERLGDVRRRLDVLEATYRKALEPVAGVVSAVQRQPDVSGYLTFFPVIVNPDEAGFDRDALQAHLERHGVLSRRYFSPLISTMPAFETARRGAMTCASRLSDRVLALPFYADLAPQDAERVAEIVASCES